MGHNRTRTPRVKSEAKIGTIYLITCTETGEMYVGLTTKRDVRERWREHFRTAKTQTHKCTALYARMRMFGRKGFKCEVLLTAPVDKLYKEEMRLIAELNTMWPNGLNMTFGGESSVKRN